jgi:hypothetical protein
LDVSRVESAQSASEPAQERSESGSIVPQTISAEELHTLLLRCHRLGARARLRLIGALLALSRSQLYVTLGFSSIRQYAARHFGYSKAQTYESIRVAEIIDGLPQLRRAFANGEISWSVLRELTRIAGPESEETWLRFAAHPRTLKEIRVEVADALRNGRKLPRDNGYGLPRLKVQFSVELEPEQHELLARALDVIAEGMASRLGRKGGVKPGEALVHLAQAVLEDGVPGDTGSPSEADEPREGEPSIFTILYRTCPDCRVSHVATEDGFVEVDPSVVARVEGDAERVRIAPEEEVDPSQTEAGSQADADAELTTGPVMGPVVGPIAGPVEKDRPNRRDLIRKVRLRDGGCCANPHCGRTHGLHAHHIRFRVDGGRTALFNETLLCRWCHRLIHQGFLEIRGNVETGLQFVTVADRMRLDLGDEESELASLPRVELVEVTAESTRVDSGQVGAKATGESIRVDSQGSSTRSRVDEFPHVLKVLRKLGWSERDARERIAHAIETGPWGDRPIHEQKLFELAVRG